MIASSEERYDFFLSRRGSVAAVAREVTDMLAAKGYKVFVQDYDIPLNANLIERMHQGIKNSRDLIILLTRDYEQSAYTRKEFSSFEAQRLRQPEERRIAILRCEDVTPEGLLADSVYQNLFDTNDPEVRKSRIMAAVEGRSQASKPPPLPFIGVPPRIATFLGRDIELDRLDAILMHDKPAVVTQPVGRVAVQGLGGVGKTSLATEYAYRYHKLYAGVCWCPAETRSTLLGSLAALSVRLGVKKVDQADLEQNAKAALRQLAEQRATWLLVYDNVSTPNEIADLLPSTGARVLITSRFSDWKEWADELQLDVLSLEEAVAFLQIRADRDEASGAGRLAETLGCLPLALDHAAAYCRRTQMSFIDYAARSSSLMAAVPRGVTYPISVAATFELAISQATEQCATSKQLMDYLACCAPERIPVFLVEGAIDNEAERAQALAALAEISLIKHDPFPDGTPAVTVHRIVQAVARERSEERGTANDAVERLITRLATIYPKTRFDDSSEWTLCAQLTSHVMALREANGPRALNAVHWPKLLKLAAGYLLGCGSYAEAEPLMRDSLSIWEHIGPAHAETTIALGNLGHLLSKKGEFSEARQLLERSLAIEETVSGPKHESTATALTNLGYLAQRQDDFAAARPMMKRALDIRLDALGPDHPDTAMSLNNFGYQLHMQGELSEAEVHYQRALAIQQAIWGEYHHHTAQTMHNLGCLFKDLGKFAESRSLLEGALAIYEKVLGPKHPNTNVARYQIARLMLAAGQPSDALAIGKTALAISKEVLGPTHRATKSDAMNVAEALHRLGRVEEAAALLQDYGINPRDEATWR